MSEGTEIARFQRKENLSSFAFSPDGKMVAISDCSQETGFYKVDNLNCELLYEIGNPWWISGLMHFSTDGQKISCGYIKPVECSSIHFLTYSLPTLQEDFECRRVLTRDYGQREKNTYRWPWEFNSPKEEKIIFEDEDDRRARFFSLVSEESLIVGSPFESEVSMMCLGELKEDDDEEEFMALDDPSIPSDISLSSDGRYRYVSENVPDDDEIHYDDTEHTAVHYVRFFLIVYVFNEETILPDHHSFSYPFSLLPVKEGVLLVTGDDELALWDFRLSNCVRSFSEVDCTGMLFLLSDDLVGCLGDWLENDCRKVNIWSIASAEIVFTTSVQGDVTSIACSDKFQFVACSEEIVSSNDDLLVVEVAVWNKEQYLWKRSVVFDDDSDYIQPQAWISRNNDIVVTWKTLDRGAGVHILNASTGATLHKVLTDRYMDDCKFLSDGNHFVCCSNGDTVVRLYNVNSGELISLVDIETQPYCLAVCSDEPLFAVAIEDIEYRLFRVHLP